jgi:hypothetical protein
VRQENSQYLKVASLFAEAIASLRPGDELIRTRRGHRTVSYFLRVEMANTLIWSKDTSRFLEAIGIYREVLSDFPEDPISRLRFGRAVAVLYDARETFSSTEAIESILHESSVEMKKAIKYIKRDQLTGPEHWINISIRSQIAYNSWILYLSAKKIEYLQRASNEAEAAYKAYLAIPKKISDQAYIILVYKALSSRVYFLADLMRVTKDSKEKLKAAKDLSESISWLNSLPQIERPYRDMYKSYDNLMCGYAALGDIVMAEKYARHTFREFRERCENKQGRALSSSEICANLITEYGEKSEEAEHFNDALIFLQRHCSWPGGSKTEALLEKPMDS